MEKKRAPRNKTIFLTPEEETRLLAKCYRENDIKNNAPLLNKTIVGDTFNILPLLPEGFVDLLIVDPPYNLSKIYGTNKFKKMRAEEYELFTRRWIEAVLHTLKETATIYICSDWETSVIIGNILSDYFFIRNRITWQREKGRGALTNWKNSMEDIWYLTKSKEYTFNVEPVKQRRRVLAPYKIDGVPKDWQEGEQGSYRDTYPSNFWDDITVPFWSMPENTDHPTQKPEKLYAKLILAGSNENDIVLDPFAGVGTASVVAKKLGRQYIAIEKEEKYCVLIEKRLEMAAHDTAIQGYAGGVFWERNTLAAQIRASKKK